MFVIDSDSEVNESGCNLGFRPMFSRLQDDDAGNVSKDGGEKSFVENGGTVSDRLEIAKGGKE